MGKPCIWCKRAICEGLDCPGRPRAPDQSECEECRHRLAGQRRCSQCLERLVLEEGWRSDRLERQRDAALARVRELERDHADLRAQWIAKVVDEMPPGSTLVKTQTLDGLRARIRAAEAVVEAMRPHLRAGVHSPLWSALAAYDAALER